MQRIRLCGVKIDNVTKKEAVARATESCGEPCVVFTPNAVMLEKCQKNPELADLLSHASLSLPDGAGVLMAARRMGTPLRERVAGIEFGESLLREAEKRGLRVFFLGGRAGVAERAAERWRETLPTLRIVGTYWGYFDRVGEENRRLLAHIRETCTDVLIVCMGFPVQERWVTEHLSQLSRLSVIACLGGSLDVWAGDVKRAPRALRRMGLEWAWRMVREPWRLRDMGTLAAFALRRERREENGRSF